eukprot:6236300-Amphidinium_carterae.1
MAAPFLEFIAPTQDSIQRTKEAGVWHSLCIPGHASCSIEKNNTRGDCLLHHQTIVSNFDSLSINCL